MKKNKTKAEDAARAALDQAKKIKVTTQPTGPGPVLVIAAVAGGFALGFISALVAGRLIDDPILPQLSQPPGKHLDDDDDTFAA